VLSRARAVGREVAAVHADDVDRQGRFPVETVTELRRTGLLGALVPAVWGGPGVGLGEAAAMVAAIAEHCASSGLILAMHHIQVACIVRHATPEARHRLLPAVVAGDLLLANAASEVGLDGERRQSLCALEAREGQFHIEKQAATVSYGEYADGVLATARRSADSAPHDQVMAICLPPSLSLTAAGDWDTLGLRGTCSQPYLLVADVPEDLVIADYADMFMRTSLPASAVLLSAVWLGIAEAAATQAHRSVRAKSRAGGGGGDAPPIAALRLAELGVPLHQLREVVAGGAQAYEAVKDTPEVETLRFSSRMDFLKLSSSTLVGEVVRRAVAICGLTGYRNRSATSMARISRDAAAAPLMVNNDRALQAMAQTLLVRKEL